MSEKTLVKIRNCSIKDLYRTYLTKIDWQMNVGEAWLVIGPNGGGKAEFLKGLSGFYDIVPNEGSGRDGDSDSEGKYFSDFEKSVAIVSLEVAARLIEEERERDESEILNKEDIGRTGRQYICEVLGGSSKKNAPLPPIAARLETLPEVKLCGVEKILDRGLKHMSTGEIRRTLLCRSL
ncbi:MAG: ATP-binding cassette domain-containing protein, partial [Treponema sp.]|nr:ATP-binding cassette domain-containing protein [Treponema sp.]